MVTTMICRVVVDKVDDDLSFYFNTKDFWVFTTDDKEPKITTDTSTYTLQFYHFNKSWCLLTYKDRIWLHDGDYHDL